MMSHRLWLHKYIPTLKSDCICIFCIQTSLLFFQVLSFPMSPRAASPSPLHRAPVCYHTRLTILIPHPWPLATTQPANAAIQTSFDSILSTVFMSPGKSMQSSLEPPLSLHGPYISFFVFLLMLGVVSVLY